MVLRFYNTLTRQKEEFISIEKDVVKIYSCGPTVYSYAHIGNLRAALFIDILKRVLRYFNFKVLDVVNITDVGHLVSDEDDGEDKMLKASKKEKKDPYEIARFYENAYLDDLKNLNIVKPKYMPRATDNIEEQKLIIEELENKGYTYVTEDGVYFDVSKFNDYGKLSGQSLDQKKAGARIQVDTHKKNPQDFALWKFLTGDNENHIMKWDSKWGLGFPGWHIECSAMSKKYLGLEFDIHTGGIDHVPVHHENEIAQNECSRAVERINFWMHNAHLMVYNDKMSKSKGNYYILNDLTKKGYSPLAFRELCLRTHYRKTINSTFEALDAAQSSYKSINDFYSKIKALKPSEVTEDQFKDLYYKTLDKFENALKDDINTPLALSAVHEFMNQYNKKVHLSENDIKTAIQLIERVDIVLGLLEKQEEIPQSVMDLAYRRQKARSLKKFDEADKLREMIKEQGYDIKDSRNTKEGFIIEKLN